MYGRLERVSAEYSRFIFCRYAPIILPVSISETGAWANTAAEMCVGIIRSKCSLEISWRTWLVKQQSFLKFRPILSKQ